MPIGLSAGAIGAIGAGVSAAGSVASGLLSSSASSAAAKAQQQTSNYAIEAQERENDANLLRLQPYNNAGQNALTRQTDLLDSYNDTVTPQLNNLLSLGNGDTAQATLEKTPGYQFALSQGLKATQNAAAARGLGVSGAALKGAASYATGLADNTYQNQYKDALSNYQAAGDSWARAFNANSSIASMGENAAAQAGNTSQAGTTNTTNLLTGLGNAQAAGTIGSANALSSGLSGLGSTVANYAQSYAQNDRLEQLQNLLMGGAGSSSIYPSTSAGAAIPVFGTQNTLFGE